jgi:SAM-dependent methyltransferase
MTDAVTRHNQGAYDQIAALYAQRQDARGGSFADLLAGLAERLPRGAAVADLGCGPAVDGTLLAGTGFRVAGLDRSAGMLAVAARALPGRVAQADLRSLPLATAALDGIWCSASLLHVPTGQTPAVLAEFARVLRPGGHLALATAVGDGTRLEPVPYAPQIRRWYFYRDPDRLRGQLAAAGLSVLTSAEQSSNRHWLKLLAVSAPGERG